MKPLLERAALRLGSPLVVFYYRFLFGREGAGGGRLADRLARWVDGWERRAGYRNLPIDAGQWEREYRDGTWSYLAGIDEVARYAVVAGYLKHLCPGGAILDVGCGEGLLLGWLEPAGRSAYLGIDLSRLAIEKAIEKATALDGRGARFEVADAESYPPERRFDAVVFNESLYYLRRPLEAALRYRPHLGEKGVIVVSQWDSRRARAIARGLAGRLRRLDETAVRGRRGTWLVSVYAAR